MSDAAVLDERLRKHLCLEWLSEKYLIMRYDVRTGRCFWSRSTVARISPLRGRLQHRSRSWLEQIGCPCVNLAPFLQIRMTLVAGWIFCRWTFLRSMICTALYTATTPFPVGEISYHHEVIIQEKYRYFMDFEFAFMGYYKGPFKNNHAKFVWNIGQKL